MANWWEAPITQAHGVAGEQGVDFGVGFHTPITAILGGIVQRVLCDVGWRCEVDVATQYQGRPATESFLHIDQPAVSVGQSLAPGDLIGLSGGQLSGGSNPDSPQYSSGPHVEFDLFQGGAWQNPIDPTALARGGPEGGTGGNPLANVPILGGVFAAGQAQGQALSTGQGLGAIAGALAGLPASIGHGLADATAAGFHDIGVFAGNQVVPLIVALVVALILFGGVL